MAVKGEVFQVGKAKITARPDIAEVLKSSGQFVDLAGADPAEAIIFESDDALTVVRQGVSAKLSWAELMRPIKVSVQSSHPKRGSIFLVGGILASMCIYVHLQEGAIAGRLEVNLDRPSPARYVQVRTGGDINIYGKPPPVSFLTE